MTAGMDVEAALRNVLSQLQQDPLRYKLFGVWWWPVKALLRRRYGPDHLALLGAFQDPETARLVPSVGLEDTLRAAFEEYGRNARYPHPAGLVESPVDGELVRIFDADAGV